MSCKVWVLMKKLLQKAGISISLTPRDLHELCQFVIYGSVVLTAYHRVRPEEPLCR